MPAPSFASSTLHRGQLLVQEMEARTRAEDTAAALQTRLHEAEARARKEGQLRRDMQEEVALVNGNKYGRALLS